MHTELCLQWTFMHKHDMDSDSQSSPHSNNLLLLCNTQIVHVKISTLWLHLSHHLAQDIQSKEWII